MLKARRHTSDTNRCYGRDDEFLDSVVIRQVILSVLGLLIILFTHSSRRRGLVKWPIAIA